MKKLLIFDWDDVFTVGSTKGYIRCYHEALLGVGIHLEPKIEEFRLKSKWGTNHIEEFKALLIENPELVEKAGQIYEELLFGETYLNELSIIPGTIELLERLNEKYILTLATGVHPDLLKNIIMPKFSIPDYFVQIASGYEFEDPNLCKPNPYSAKIIMAKQNVSPTETVMIGDAKNDMLMAKEAGIDFIAVLTGHLNELQATELGVSNIINNLSEIEKVLAQL